MFPARTAARGAITISSRTARTSRLNQIRCQSSTSSSSGNAKPSTNTHLSAGIAGGLAAGTILYATYLLTPSGQMHRTINKGAKEAKDKYQEASKKLQGSTPNVDDAIKYIKEFCYSYVGWVPGGRQYVDTAFKDVETLRENHRDEVNQIISDAYRQFQELSKSGLSLEAASKAYEILADLMTKFGSLSGDALSSILDNHPEIKQKFGGSIDQLKDMGDKYGPEAKKKVNDTWNEVKDILGSGLSASNLDRVRKLVEDKAEEVKKLGNQAWDKGMEQAKPYLDRNPKVKELIEKNADSLKQGNARELFEKAKNAVESRDTASFEQYVNKTVEKAKSKGSQASGAFGLDQYFNVIPNGSEILEKVNHLKEIAEKHKDEGQQLLKETMDELKQVLDNKSKKAQEIAEKAQKGGK